MNDPKPTDGVSVERAATPESSKTSDHFSSQPNEPATHPENIKSEVSIPPNELHESPVIYSNTKEEILSNEVKDSSQDKNSRLGVIKFINTDSSSGGITPNDDLNLKGRDFLYFGAGHVVSGKIEDMLKGEPVQFNVVTREDGRAVATAVERIGIHMCGTVKLWKQRHGFAISNEHDVGEVFIHSSQIVSRDKFLREGDRIEFFVLRSDIEERTSNKAPMAISVKKFEAGNALREFASLERFESGGLLEILADPDSMAQYEQWDYEHDTTRRRYPILYNYIRFTFARLLEEKKIKEAKTKNGERVACFNTGLVTKNQEEIFGYFRERIGIPRWYLASFEVRSSRKLGVFQPLPDTANYFSHAIELLYDTTWDLRPDYDHIYERIDRFPLSFQENPYKDKILEASIREAVTRVKRNYKTAIPQFFGNKVQLLLPLCLDAKDKADLALVVRRGEPGVYFAETVLTLDMAYNNARLIARPDREWLEPRLPVGREEKEEDTTDRSVVGVR